MQYFPLFPRIRVYSDIRTVIQFWNVRATHDFADPWSLQTWRAHIWGCVIWLLTLVGTYQSHSAPELLRHGLLQRMQSMQSLMQRAVLSL